jgi:hypothetical protein
LGDQADLGVGLTFFEVVVDGAESLDVVPLGVGIDNVFFQLDVGDGTVAVVGVFNIAINVISPPPVLPLRDIPDDGLPVSNRATA